MQPRLCRVEAVVERPPAPSWIGELPYPETAHYWPGTMLDWRWSNREAQTWTALVRYQRDGLTYLHWVSGELLDLEPEESCDLPVDGQNVSAQD